MTSTQEATTTPIDDAAGGTAKESLAHQMARLDPDAEQKALQWIEQVSEFDNP